MSLYVRCKKGLNTFLWEREACCQIASLPSIASLWLVKEQFSLIKANGTALDTSEGRGITRNASGFGEIALGLTHLKKQSPFSPHWCVSCLHSHTKTQASNVLSCSLLLCTVVKYSRVQVCSHQILASLYLIFS